MDDVLQERSNGAVTLLQPIEHNTNNFDATASDNCGTPEPEPEPDRDTPLKPGHDWTDIACSQYAPATREKLTAVRKSQWVSDKMVRTYLQKTLQELTETVPIETCLKRIREIHDTLIFKNPLRSEHDSEMENGGESQIHLCIPPGIENQGATCYLNTQMQCLARNPVFVAGIFSWTPSGDIDKDKDPMDSVLALFQNLLLRMNCGPESVVNTVEFADALELDCDEQQDPSEFSRLLLNKMHDFFQATSMRDGCNLAELLPHVFQGVIVYETTCLSCRTQSARKEEFMDLNLPIVHPKSNGHIGKALESNSDTNVQFCLASYCENETLDGENQYFCSKCECKRDAVRALKFQKLPPVLNVQISRYVFDRKRLDKKKLNDKVLLPVKLNIETEALGPKEGLTKHRYVLCAVMRHKGKSAYTGHYVAETMDWMTGQWFEFNDENVFLLENGPSCSYDPTLVDQHASEPASNKAKGKKPAPVSGSQDAYSMYYVEESFLAQCLLDGLRIDASLPVVDTREKIAAERIDFYCELARYVKFSMYL